MLQKYEELYKTHSKVVLEWQFDINWYEMQVEDIISRNIDIYSIIDRLTKQNVLNRLLKEKAVMEANWSKWDKELSIKET